MKSRESILRLKRFDQSEKARKVLDLQSMIREFDMMVLDLDRQIAAEEDRSGVRDQTHFNYSTYAKSAALRRANLQVSIADLVAKLELAVKARDVAMSEVTATEAADHFEKSRAKPERYSSLMR